MKIPSNIITLIAGILLTLVSLWYGQNNNLLPVAASDEAVLVDGLFNAMMTVSVGIFLLVQGILVFCFISFRRRPDDTTDGPPIHGNVPLEIVWTAIPAVIVLIIGIYSFDIYKSMGGFDPNAAADPGVTQIAMAGGEGESTGLGLFGADASSAKPRQPHHHHVALGIGAFPGDEGKPADLSVNVTGLQYAWLFNYGASGVTAGELHLPVDREVQLTITAQDVIHAFWLPEFRLKQDAIPGRPAELRFLPKRIGTYPVICAELCGAYHGAMNTKVFVESQEDFDSWLQSQIAQKESDQTVAVNLGDRTVGDRLAPYVSDLGINADTLQQLHPAHHHQAAAEPVENLTPSA